MPQYFIYLWYKGYLIPSIRDTSIYRVNDTSYWFIGGAISSDTIFISWLWFIVPECIPHTSIGTSAISQLEESQLQFQVIPFSILDNFLAVIYYSWEREFCNSFRSVFEGEGMCNLSGSPFGNWLTRNILLKTSVLVSNWHLALLGERVGLPDSGVSLVVRELMNWIYLSLAGRGVGMRVTFNF